MIKENYRQGQSLGVAAMGAPGLSTGPADITNKKYGVVIDTKLARVFRMKKGVMTTARLVNDRLREEKIRWVPVMVTLTYKDADAWQPNHITQFMNRVQMYAKRRCYTFPNVWVMELQKRGAPHYHCLIWIPARLRMPKSDRQGWWQHGSTNICRVKNAVGYVAKYASKFESKDATFPRGARIHGIGGITKLEKRIVAWWKLPKDLRTGAEGSCAWQRNEGGGWKCKDTGRVVESDWGMSSVSDIGTITLVRKPRIIDQYDHKAENQQAVIERYLDLSWRIDLSRQQRLEHLQATDRVSVVHYFEGVERGAPAF